MKFLLTREPSRYSQGTQCQLERFQSLETPVGLRVAVFGRSGDMNSIRFVKTVPTDHVGTLFVHLCQHLRVLLSLKMRKQNPCLMSPGQRA